MRDLLRKFFKPTPAPQPKPFPPVPKWRPSFKQPLDAVVERMHYYAGGKRDFAIFENGTCAVVPEGLTEEDAKAAALQILSAIFNYHADMNPADMDDGNVLVRYNQPAFNVVLSDFARAHWDEIEARYLDALAESEVMINAGGKPNIFDERGKKGLFGRCYMFMDAQAPVVVRIERAKASSVQ